MSRVRTIANPRRLLLPLLLVATAAAIAAAFVLDPGTTTESGLANNPGGGNALISPTPDVGRDLVTTTPASKGAMNQVEEPADDRSGESVTSSGSVGSSAVDAAIVGSDPAELGLKILQNGSVVIELRKSKFNAGFARARALAGALGGYVVASNLSDAGDGQRSATLTVRIPNNRFDRALDRLDGLGKVTSLEVSSSDVTQEYVDAKSRLRHDQAVEAQLLRLLGRTKTVGDALVIQDRLATIQQNIEVEKGRIQYLDKMTQLATIEISLTERATGRDEAPVSRWGLTRALDDAAHRFVGNVNRMIIGLGGALPALLVLGLALLVGRSVWRRKR